MSTKTKPKTKRTRTRRAAPAARLRDDDIRARILAVRIARVELELAAAVSALDAMEVPFSLARTAAALEPQSLGAKALARGTGHPALEYLMHRPAPEFRAALVRFMTAMAGDDRLSRMCERIYESRGEERLVRALAGKFVELRRR